MNIIKQEVKMGFRVCCLWVIGLGFLVLAGMTKYLGVGSETAKGDIMALFDQFPKVVLAVFGMANVDIQTLGGYYSVLAFYGILFSMLYGISLGTNTILKEQIDKTFEFLFTKPRKVTKIFHCKMVASIGFLAVFSLTNIVFSFLAMPLLGISNTIKETIVCYSLVMFLVGVFSYFLGSFLGIICKEPETGIRNSYLCFTFFYFMSVVFDMVEENEWFRFLTPFRYFDTQELLEGKLSITYLILILALSGLLYGMTMQCHLVNLD